MEPARRFAFVLGVVALGAVVLAGLGWGAAGFPMPGGHHGGMGNHHESGTMRAMHDAMHGSPSDESPPDNLTVLMTGSTFKPASLTIRVGETVTWVNRDAFVHTVTSDEGAELDSGDVPADGTFRHTFTRAGTYAYHCEPHAYADESGAYRGMVGRIVVVA